MIPSSVNRVSYNGNGVTTEFSYGFKIIDATDIKVMTVSPLGVETVLTSDYYVDTVASKVHYPGYAPGAEEPVEEQPPILPTGWRLIIYREVPITQLTALDEHWPFKDIENMSDKLTIIAQQLLDAVNRSFKASESTTITGNITIPVSAGKSFRWNDAGTGLVVTEDPAKVLPLANAALAATEAARDALLLRPGYIAVEADLTNIDNVAGDLTNIDNCSTNILDISAVGSAITKVTAVADNLTAINAVKNDLTNIDIVAGDHTYVVALGGISTEVAGVYAIRSAVSAVDSNAANINTVSTYIMNVNAVAGNLTAINGVYNNSTNINTVVGMSSNIAVIVADKTNIDAVAGDLANIDAASGHAALSKQYAIGVPTEPPEGSAKYWAGQASQGQIQSDLAQTDNTKKDFIKNKQLQYLADDATHRLVTDTEKTTWNGKQNPSTTLSGYGITDAYTKTETDGLLNDKVNINQGAVNVGKALIVDESGHAVPQSIPSPVPTYGVEPNPITHRRKVVGVDNVTLYWRDPEDSYAEGTTLALWNRTVIVKKQGSLPANINDGTVVVTSTVRHQYYNNGFVDNQANGDQWYYRAFPVSEGNLASSSRLNDFQFWLFGCCIDESIADPAQSISTIAGTDNYYYAKPVMNFGGSFDYGGWLKWENIPFGGRPCMLKYDGTVDYYLDVNNLTKKEDGVTASDVTNSAYGGNAMMEFPTMWFKSEKIGTKIYKYLCSEKLDNNFDAYSWMNSDNTYEKYVYRAIYEGVNVSSKLRSYSSGGKPTASLTMATEMSYARANGSGWTCTTWALERVLIAAFQIIFLHNDSQSVLGTCPTSSSALTLNCGAGNDKGPMYGGSSSVVKFLGMENPWSHRWRRFEGMTTLSLQYYVKMTRHTGDGSTASEFDPSGTGYIATGVYIPSGASASYITKTSGESKTSGLVTTASGGSSSTYYCDACWSGASPCGPLLGGSVFDGAAGGVSSLACHVAPSYSYWAIGASVEFKKPL